jgi:hypothetical protein
VKLHRMTETQTVLEMPDIPQVYDNATCTHKLFLLFTPNLCHVDNLYPAVTSHYRGLMQ